MSGAGGPSWLVFLLAALSPLGAILVAVVGPRGQRQGETAIWLRENRMTSYLALLDSVTGFRLTQTELNRSTKEERVAVRRMVYVAYLDVQKSSNRAQILGPNEIVQCAIDILEKVWEWTKFGYEETPDENYGPKGYQLNLELKDLESEFLDLALSAFAGGNAKHVRANLTIPQSATAGGALDSEPAN